MGTTLLCGSLAIIAAASVNGFGKRAGFFLLAAVWVMVIGDADLSGLRIT